MAETKDVDMADAPAAKEDTKKPAAAKSKKALPAPRFEIKKWNVSTSY